jgi:hypothetical protein
MGKLKRSLSNMNRSKETGLYTTRGGMDSVLKMLITRGFDVTLSVYCSLYVFTLD